MSITHNYEVDVNWVKDRIGIMYSPELNDEVQVATPPQFPNGVDKVWSPEHLFTAAINSCLMTTFLSVAENSKLDFDKFTSRATGKLEMVEGRYIMSEVTLMPALTIHNEEDREKAMKVLSKAENACLISNSVKSKINFQPEIRVKA
jgi:peroxiredoxin-like protein